MENLSYQVLKRDIMSSARLKIVAPDPVLQPFYEFLFSILVTEQFWMSVDKALEKALTEIDGQLRASLQNRYQQNSHSTSSFNKPQTQDRPLKPGNTISTPVSPFQSKFSAKSINTKSSKKILPKIDTRPKTPVFTKPSPRNQPFSSRNTTPSPFNKDKSYKKTSIVNKEGSFIHPDKTVSSFYQHKFDSSQVPNDLFKTKTINENSQLQSVGSSFNSFFDQEMRDLAYFGVQEGHSNPLKRKQIFPNDHKAQTNGHNFEGSNFKTINKAFNQFDEKYSLLKNRFTKVLEPILQTDSLQSSLVEQTKPRSNTLQYSTSLPGSAKKEEPVFVNHENANKPMDIKDLFSKWKKQSEPVIVEEVKPIPISLSSKKSSTKYVTSVHNGSSNADSDPSVEIMFSNDILESKKPHESLKGSQKTQKENNRYKSITESSKQPTVINKPPQSTLEEYDYEKDIKLLSLRDTVNVVIPELPMRNERQDRRESIKDNFVRRDSLLKQSGLLFTFERKSNPLQNELPKPSEVFVRNIQKFED